MLKAKSNNGNTVNKGWTVQTVRNSPNIGVTVGWRTIGCTIIEQIVTTSNGEKQRIETHIGNDGEYIDVIMM